MKKSHASPLIKQTTCYQWKGLTRLGEKRQGLIEATSKASARHELIQQGILAIKIIKKRQLWPGNPYRTIKRIDIILLTRHLATFTKAGIGLMQSLAFFKKNHSNPKMAFLLSSIQTDLESGLLFTDALRRHPKVFNALFCGMIYAGEQSGTLDMMLDKMATHQEKRASIRKKVKKALAYPTAIALMAILVTAGLLIFVIPQFERLFTDFGADLPAFTQFVIYLSNVIQHAGFMIASVIGACVYAMLRIGRHVPALTHWQHMLILKLPIMGPIIQKTAIAQVSRTLSITVAAGLPLTDALDIVSGVTGNNLYASAIVAIKKEVSNGHSLCQSMQVTSLFPGLVTQMIAIGEESGTLEHMLSKAADFYEEDMEHAIDALHSLLEPFIMSLLGLLVGGLVVAMYLPILKLGTVL